MIDNIKIVVLTPTKNESWIIRQFLQVTSQFADLIIIADQFSTDETESIVSEFSKVIFIKNDNPEYDEEYRQKLLINKARELLKEPKLILALDADELLAANSLDSKEWSVIKSLKPGTVIKFKKYDVIFPNKSIRHVGGFPLGYMDDGSEHKGKKFHSPRIPIKEGSPIYEANDIVFMHYALARENEYWARQKLYSINEKLKNTKTLKSRLSYYSRQLNDFEQKFKLEPLPNEWFQFWEVLGFKVREISSSPINHYNKQVMQLLMEHGGNKFWLDDIWYEDFAKLSEGFQNENFDKAYLNAIRPSVFYNFIRNSIIKKIKFEYFIKNKIKTSINKYLMFNIN